MNKHELDIYIELYKRGEYKHIPIGSYPSGEYFYPTIKQVKALELLNDDITTFTGYGGSARSGKSIIECVAIIMDCLSYPDIAWGLARKELTTLKRTVLLTMFKQLDFYGISPVKGRKPTESEFTYHQDLNKLTFGNNSDVFLIDTAYKPSDPLNTRFGGFELTRSAIDESNETEQSVILKLFERTGWRNNDTYGLKRKQFECFNPAKNHVYTRFYVPYRDNNEKEHVKFIPALPRDNPHPSVKEWIDDIIKTGDTVTIERQVNGNFDYDDDPSALCRFDAISDLFTNTHVTGGNSYISTDLAMQGRDKFIAGYWNGLQCSIEIDIPKNDAKVIEDTLRSLKNKKGVPNSRIVADSDGLGQYLSAYIKNIYTFHGGASAKNKKDFVNLKAECAFKLAELINNREIYIQCSTEQRDRLMNELSVCLKRDNVDNDTQKKKLISKDKMKSLLGHSPDYMDMLIMRMVYLVKPNNNNLIGF